MKAKCNALDRYVFYLSEKIKVNSLDCYALYTEGVKCTALDNYILYGEGITGITMPINLSLMKNWEFKLNPIITPEDVFDKTLVWSTSNPDIVMVDNTGCLIGISQGSAIIEVKTVNNRKAECVVTVVNGIGEKFEQDSLYLPFTGDWERTSRFAEQGMYSYRSKVITHNGSTSTQVTIVIEQSSTLTFSYLVSSEGGYDKFRFYLDNVEKLNKSGTSVTTWTEYSIVLPAGEHALKWTYGKDGSGSTGEDAAFIDNIVIIPNNEEEVS